MEPPNNSQINLISSRELRSPVTPRALSITPKIDIHQMISITVSNLFISMLNIFHNPSSLLRLRISVFQKLIVIFLVLFVTRADCGLIKPHCRLVGKLFE